ncbi:MAG: N-acetylmuramoyl-L-alanine amidase [Candidatus Eisenbacteria bacterium]
MGEGAWNGAEPRALRVRLRDEDGLPAGASQPVTLRLEAAHGVAPVETTVVAAGGEAWFYLRATRPLRRDALKAFVRTMGETRELHALALVPLDPAATPLVRTGFARELPQDRPLAEAGRADWLSRDGFVTVPADSGVPRLPALPGWRRWGAGDVWPPRFVAIAGGALRGRRIALDPEGGGDDAAGMGRSGARAATLNLEVARVLAAMLRAAGAEVVLTRGADAAVSELERVQAAERFRADRFLRIGHAAAPPLAGYYFSSGGGRRWALALARACADLGVTDSLASGESAKYALSQVSAVALYASLRRVDDPASEERLLAPGALRAEAYALFLALARDCAPAGAPAWPTDSLTLARADGSPASGALVTLGGALLLQADAAGVVRFARTEPGPIEVRGADSRSDLRGLLLDSDRGRTLTGAR